MTDADPAEPAAEELAAVLAALRRSPGSTTPDAVATEGDPVAAAVTRWRRRREQALRRGHPS